jgi:serine/threonine protein kinase
MEILKVIGFVEFVFTCFFVSITDENILVDWKMHIKLIDFGASSIVHGDACFIGYMGTLFYAPPEVFLGVCIGKCSFHTINI